MTSNHSARKHDTVFFFFAKYVINTSFHEVLTIFGMFIFISIQFSLFRHHSRYYENHSSDVVGRKQKSIGIDEGFSPIAKLVVVVPVKTSRIETRHQIFKHNNCYERLHDINVSCRYESDH